MVMVADYYIAYYPSDRLQRHARDYIHRLHSTRPEENLQSLTVALRLLAFETIDIYLMGPFKSQEPPRMRKKLLDVADKAIKTTTSGVIRQVARKLDIAQQKQVAEHIDSCLLPWERGNLQEVELIACPISESVYHSLRQEQGMLSEEAIEHTRQTVLTRQKIIFDTVVEYMVERLVAIIKLGPINQRLVRAAIDKSVSLTHSTFERLVATMDQGDLRNATNRMNELLIKADKPSW